jgi:ribosomal protein L37AE/L43A
MNNNQSNEDARYLCVVCGGFIDHARYHLGYKLCKPCGEDAAKQVKHTVAPLNKSNYYYISNMEMLKQLNPKRTT